MSEQPRERDGRFAAMPLGEVDATLHVAPKGSYLFPDFLDQADEVVAFYDRVEIPDEVCMHVSKSFKLSRPAVPDVYPQHYWDNVELSWRERHGEDTSEAAEREFVASYADRLRQLPDALDPRDARVAAKVIGMNDAAYQLPVEEADMVRNTLVETSAGEKSMREAYRDWALGMFAVSTVDPETYRAGTQDIREELARILARESADLRDHIDASLRQTGSAIIDAI